MPGGKEKEIVMGGGGSLDDYEGILEDVRGLIDRAKYQAYKAVDNIRVQTYWQIGERIVWAELDHKERADYGKYLIERLAGDIGFQRSVLYRIVQFYKAYPIVAALRQQLSWTHYRILITIEEDKVRAFYENLTIQNSWSSRELKEQIRLDLYSKTIKKGKLIIPTPQLLNPVKPEKAFKDSYDFDFLSLKEDYIESDLEMALISDVEALILEFGTDFYLSGRQKPIIIDGEYHSIDLEFYHRGIPCIVLVDLKKGRFKAEYVGQMNKYLNYYRENKKYPWEKDPVGLIICEYKGDEEVHYALGNIDNKIFVAEYRLQLPSAADIREGLKRLKK